MLIIPSSFETAYFKKEAVAMAETTEYVVKGGTHLYPICGDVFKATGISVLQLTRNIIFYLFPNKPYKLENWSNWLGLPSTCPSPKSCRYIGRDRNNSNYWT